MLTVSADASAVEASLSSRRLRCPGCAGRLAPWGHGRARIIRDDGQLRWRLRPRRARCPVCGATHVLLPASCLLRRADAAGVIGAALEAAGTGWGHRRVAVLLARPASTVRGWLRRSNARAGPLRHTFTALAVELDPAPVMPDPAGSALGDAVAAILLAASAVRARWPESMVTVSAWHITSAVASGRLLAPTLPTEWINTSRLW